MRSYPSTPSPEEFAQVGAAAIFLTYRLIFFCFPDLMIKMPNRVATGFIFVVAGMMCIPKNQTIHRIAKQLGLASHDTLERVVMEKSWVAADIMAALITFTLTFISGTAFMGYLILDDVIIPKRYAKKLAYVYWDYDYVNRKKIRCMRIVLLLWTNGYIKLPVGYAIWHKKGSAFLTERGLDYRTKNDLAMELIREALECHIPFEYLTFDTWYAGRSNLQLLHNELHIKFVTALKCTTNIRFVRDTEPEEKRKCGHPKCYDTLQCQRLAEGFPATRCHYYKQIDVRARGFLVSFRSVSDELKLVLVRHYVRSWYLKDIAEGAKKKRHPHKYLLTNMTDLTVVKIVQRYRSRWAIETFFRDIKQHLGSGRLKGRTVEHAQRHVALVLIAYVCLELLKDVFASSSLPKEKMTIGDVKLALCTHFVQCSKAKGTDIQIKPLSPMTRDTFEQIQHRLQEGCPDNLALEDILYSRGIQSVA
jgi:SRSO17 transposase